MRHVVVFRRETVVLQVSNNLQKQLLIPNQTFNQLVFRSRSVLDILSCVRSVTLGNTVISPHLNSLKQDKSLSSKFT
jgi:hypothetical protein